MNKHIYALYEDFETAVTVANKLIIGGYSPDDISVITRDEEKVYSAYMDSDNSDVEGGEGAGFGAIVGTLTGLAVALIPGFGPIVAAGPLGAALLSGVGAATGAATGGIVASLVHFGTSEEDARHYEDVLRNGGALLIVHTVGDKRDEVESIIHDHEPIAFEDYS